MASALTIFASTFFAFLATTLQSFEQLQLRLVLKEQILIKANLPLDLYDKALKKELKLDNL